MTWQPEPDDTPSGPNSSESFSIRLQALADEWKAQQRDAADLADASGTRSTDRETSDDSREYDLLKSVHDAYIAVATASLDRALQRGTYMVAASSAVVTLYTGILGVRFATGKGNQLIPTRGIIPALYLGAAIAFSAVYVSFIKSTPMSGRLLPSGIGGQIAEVRLVAFLHWTSTGVLQRSWAIRSGVGSLSLGCATLPLPFLNVSDRAAFLSELGWIFVILLAVAWKPRPWGSV